MKNRLTGRGSDASLRTFEFSHGKSLQHYRIKSHARKCDSPARYGQEKGRRGPSRHQERAPHLQPEPARTPYLGAGTEEIRPDSRDRARDEDVEQERRLRDVEESRIGSRVAVILVLGSARVSRVGDGVSTSRSSLVAINPFAA